MLYLQDVHGDVALDSGNDNLNNSRIEPTKAEAEAISRGLQVSDSYLIRTICTFMSFT